MKSEAVSTQEMTKPQPTSSDGGSLGRFLESLFPDLTQRYRIELRAFDLEKRPRRKWFGAIEEVIHDALFLADTHDVYFGVTARFGETGHKEGVGYCNALFCDADDWPAVEGKLNEEFPPPSAIIHSGRGRHLYWLLKDPFRIETSADILKFEIANKGVATFLGADNCSDISHVYRMPGTLNHKAGGPYPVELAELHQERRYTLEDFGAYVGIPRAQKVGTGQARADRMTRPWAGFVPLGDRNTSQFAEACDMAEAGLTEAGAEVVLRRRFVENYEQGGPGGAHDMLSTLQSAYRFVARRHKATLQAAGVHENGEKLTSSEVDGEPCAGPGSALATRRPTYNLPAEFWAKRNSLQQIRKAAHSCNRSADAVLQVVLARLAAMMPGNLRIETGVGSPASLNYLVAMVGNPGTGKSDCSEIGRLWLAAPPGSHEWFEDNQPLGSGEGLAEAYMGVKEEPSLEPHGKPVKVRQQVRNNAYFFADEGEALIRVSDRKGATIGEALRRGWKGVSLGQKNGTIEHTRVVSDYAMGVVIGFQPTTIAPLLADASSGTPQRFIYTSVVDPAIPNEPVSWPGACDWEPGLKPLQPLTLHPEILDEVHNRDLARAQGRETAASLDAHEILSKIKIAALLAALEGRTHVDLEDWLLAHMVWRTSCAIRDALVAEAAAARVAKDQAAVKRKVLENRAIVSDTNELALERAVKKIVRYVISRQDEEKACTPGRVANAVGRDRDVIDVNEAIERALARGHIELRDRRYWPGKKSL